MSENKKNLYYLEELTDYKVATDYYDVRGWDVIDTENRNVGKVTDLLVSKLDERVVYLVVEVDKSLIEVGYETYQVPASEGVHGFSNKDGADQLIVPIGMVSLNTEQKNVLTNQIDYTTFTKARRFSKGTAIDRDYEIILFRHYIGDETIDKSVMDEDFYKRKEFDNSLN